MLFRSFLVVTSILNFIYFFPYFFLSSMFIRSLLVVTSILNFIIFFFLFFLSSLGRSHVGSFFINEEQKMLDRDVIDTFVAHAGLFMTSLTETARHNLATLTIFLFFFFCFATLLTAIFNKQEQKSNEKVLCVQCSLHSRR